MGYLLGIDCGGTKIQAIAYKRTGEKITEIIGGAGNLVVDYDKSKNEIIRVVEKIKALIPDQECLFSLLGVAGLDAGGFKEQLTKDLQKTLTNFALVNDGQLAHFNCLNGKDGIVVISGTGSVAIGRWQGTWYRAGGWGHILGDEGSAYWIGRCALQQLLQEADNGMQPTKFSKKVMSYLGVATVQQAVKKFYQMNKAEVAKIAAFIATELNMDEITQNIFQRAGSELGKMACHIAKRIKESGDLTPPFEYQISMTGSVLEYNETVCDVFISEIMSNYPAYFNKANTPNAHGVLPYYNDYLTKGE